MDETMNRLEEAYQKLRPNLHLDIYDRLMRDEIRSLGKIEVRLRPPITIDNVERNFLTIQTRYGKVDSPELCLLHHTTYEMPVILDLRYGHSDHYVKRDYFTVNIPLMRNSELDHMHGLGQNVEDVNRETGTFIIDGKEMILKMKLNTVTKMRDGRERTHRMIILRDQFRFQFKEIKEHINRELTFDQEEFLRSLARDDHRVLEDTFDLDFVPRTKISPSHMDAQFMRCSTDDGFEYLEPGVAISNAGMEIEGEIQRQLYMGDDSSHLKRCHSVYINEQLFGYSDKPHIITCMCSNYANDLRYKVSFTHDEASREINILSGNYLAKVCFNLDELGGVENVADLNIGELMNRLGFLCYCPEKVFEGQGPDRNFILHDKAYRVFSNVEFLQPKMGVKVKIGSMKDFDDHLDMVLDKAFVARVVNDVAFNPDIRSVERDGRRYVIGIHDLDADIDGFVKEGEGDADIERINTFLELFSGQKYCRGDLHFDDPVTNVARRHFFGGLGGGVFGGHFIPRLFRQFLLEL